ncbi:MAG: hypothetical protein U9N81_08120 [Bacillota bacterium]|nr:hypothetical protein [Bacillota bacterium]
MFVYSYNHDITVLTESPVLFFRMLNSYKLFIITAGVFIIFLAVKIALQSAFLDKFYINKKIEISKQEIEKFSDKLVNFEWDKKQLNEETDLFSKQNNSPVIIGDERGVLEYGGILDDFIIVEENDGRVYKVYTDSVIESVGETAQFDPALEIIDSKNLLTGDQVNLKGIITDENSVFPVEINMGETEYKEEANNIKEDGIIPWQEIPPIKEIQGNVVYVNETKNQSDYYKNDLLMSEVSNYLNMQVMNFNTLPDANLIQYSKIDQLSGINNLFFIKPLYMKDGSTGFFHSL